MKNLNLKTKKGLKIVETAFDHTDAALDLMPALIGFTVEEFPEAERIADELDGMVTLLYKEDDWSLYERDIPVDEPITPEEEYYGYDARLVTKGYYDNERHLISIEMEEPDAFVTVEELKYRVEELEEIWEHYKNLNDNEVILIKDNRFNRVLPKAMMESYYNRFHRVIGVVFEEEWLDTVKKQSVSAHIQ